MSVARDNWTKKKGRTNHSAAPSLAVAVSYIRPRPPPPRSPAASRFVGRPARLGELYGPMSFLLLCRYTRMEPSFGMRT